MTGRTMWNGVLQFGMVNLPISLLKGANDGKPKLSLACPHGHKLRFERVCDTCGGDKVGYQDCKHAFFIKNGKESTLAMSLSHEDLELFKRTSDKSIRVTGVVPLSEVDHRYIKDSYWVVPQHVKETGYLGVDGYVLLRDALSLNGVGLLCKMAIRSRERICLLRACGNYLVAHLLWYAKELNQPDIPELNRQANQQGLAMAQAILSNARVGFGEWMPEQIDDDAETLASAIRKHAKAGAMIVEKAEKPKAKRKVRVRV